MSWESFYLIAFFIGFLLSVISFVAGVGRLPHMPHMPHLHGHAHVGKITAQTGGRAGISPFNFGTAAAFLAWFGGTGYLLERYSSIWIWLALFASIMSGLGGAAVVFWFLSKLMAREHPLDPADYEMVGVLGRVASAIQQGGTGEMIYSRDGARHAVPVRTEDNAPISKGIEVLVTRYEKGIAYVRRWEEMSGTDGL